MVSACPSDSSRASRGPSSVAGSSTSSISSSCWYCVHCTASSEPSSGVGASCDIVHLGASENLDDVHDVWHTRHVPRETLLMPHRRRRAAASARPRHRRPHRRLCRSPAVTEIRPPRCAHANEVLCCSSLMSRPPGPLPVTRVVADVLRTPSVFTTLRRSIAILHHFLPPISVMKWTS